MIAFPFLSILRGKTFDRLSLLLNWGLVFSGMLLLVYQLNGYFTSDHNHIKEIQKHIHDDDEHHPHSH